MVETPTLQTSSILFSPEELAEKYTMEELAEGLAYLQKLSVRNNPLRLVEGQQLTIKDKSGQLIPLTLNRAQQRLHDRVSQLWADDKIIRMIILKARQLGISTYVEALIYAITSQRDGQNGLIISHDVDGSNYLFEMSKLYQEQCPVWLRPETKKSNEKKIEFDGTHSQILIDTAENKEAGRGFTFRVCHLSEVAFFKKVNYNEITLGLGHSVPSLGRTIVIKESTANGFNHFKDDWDRAVAGDSDEIPIFIPWYWGDDYMMAVDETFIVGDPVLGEITEDEPAIVARMDADGIDRINERLQWRRWDIKNNCKGDVERFKQENPSFPEESFLASGQCFFSQKELCRQLELATAPLYRANIVKENYKFVLRKCQDGDYWFYREPSKTGQYCIGGDACSGSGTDFAALVARDKQTNEIVCVYHAKCDSDEMAFRAMTLGSFLNNAVVGIENDKFGFAANEKLRTMYGNIYVQRSYNKLTNVQVEKFGFDTTAVTRPLILGRMQEEVREDSLMLSHEKLIRECLTFIKNADKGRPEAEGGYNDDLVMACAISGQLRSEAPWREVKQAGRGDDDDRKNAGIKFSAKNSGLSFGRRK